MGAFETYFERDFFFPRDLSAALADGDDSPNSDNGGSGGGPGAQTSGTFLYGAFAFVVTARPRLLLGTWRKNGAVGVAVSVARKFRNNSQSLLCRLNFVVSVGSGENKLESEVKDESIGPQVCNV